MQRLSALRVRTLARVSSTSTSRRSSSTVTVHLQHQARARPRRAGLQHPRPLPTTVSTPRPASTTSAPKEAEQASAQSGGSRSKDAAEAAEAASSTETTTTTPDPTTAGIDSLAEREARGRTGGGEPLGSSSRNAPAKPKISNASVPGTDGKPDLTPEQREEVEAHNREFRKRHDRASEASRDKVDKNFWSGGGTRENVGTK